MDTNKKKIKTYDIYCEFDLNTRVQRFAQRYAFERTVVEVRSRRRWFKADPRVTVTFKTSENRTDIYRKFVEEFKEYHLEIVGTELYVYKKIEEESI